MFEKLKYTRLGHRPFVCIIGLASALLTIVNAEPSHKDGSKKKIVFVAGKPSHPPGEHEHRAGCMLLADQLNKSGLPVEAVVTINGWPEDPTIFDGASAVVIYSDGGPGHPAFKQLDDLKKLSAKGVGIGCIHYAVEIPKGEPGDVLLDVIGGYFETNWSVNPTWNANFKIPEHAVTRGIHDFGTRDEWYYHMRFPEGMKGVTPILTDLPPASSLTRPDGPHEGNPEVRAAVLERKEPQHVMWVYQSPKNNSRGFGFCGGHYHKNWQQDDQRRLALNTIVWIAGIEVPKTGVPSPTPSDEEMKANLDMKNGQ